MTSMCSKQRLGPFLKGLTGRTMVDSKEKRDTAVETLTSAQLASKDSGPMVTPEVSTDATDALRSTILIAAEKAHISSNLQVISDVALVCESLLKFVSETPEKENLKEALKTLTELP